ncbi:hypothetical protein P9112_003315 [Eukaryota sp. TZLM1-RC]
MSHRTASLINGLVGHDINSNPPHQESPPTKKSNPFFGKSNPSQESELPAKKSLAFQKGSHLPNKGSFHHGDDDSELYAPFPCNSLETLPCRKSFLTPSEQSKYSALVNTNSSNVGTEGEGSEGAAVHDWLYTYNFFFIHF